MNKFFSSAAALVLCSSLYGQNISVTSGWHLKGATEDISNMAVFSSDCVSTVWTYDNGWKAFSADASTLTTLESSLGASNIAGSISSGNGFWIYGAGTCTIDTNAEVSSGDSTYTLQASDLSGKTFTMDANDNEGWVTFTLNSDGTGTEIGYYQSGSQEYSETITWNVNSNKLNITLNSDSSTAYITFNAKPANGVTGTYVGNDEIVNIDISNFGDISTSSTTENTSDSTSETITFKGLTYITVTSPHTGKEWLDRNLGATQACTLKNDGDCYGDYYQWGRNADGHQLSTSSTTSTTYDSLNPTESSFVINNNDWTSEDSSGDLRKASWSMTDGTSICPTGFRVPTIEELKAETTDVGLSTYKNLSDSFLKLPLSGLNHSSLGSMAAVNNIGYLWSSSTDGSYSQYLNYEYYDFSVKSYIRTFGHPVRCIKD